jgi:hypothetical protein
MMRRLLVAALLVLVAAEPCFGLAHGIFHRAKTTDPGSIYGGGYVILVEDDIVIMGQGRMGLASDIEAGLRMAVGFHDPNTYVTIGGDGQFLFLESTQQLPINISGVGGLDVTIGDDYNAFTLGFGGLIDGEWKLRAGRKLYPQGGLLITHTRADFNGASDSDTDIVISGGMIFQISDVVGFLVEVRLADDSSIGLGLNFR